MRLTSQCKGVKKTESNRVSGKWCQGGEKRSPKERRMEKKAGLIFKRITGAVSRRDDLQKKRGCHKSLGEGSNQKKKRSVFQEQEGVLHEKKGKESSNKRMELANVPGSGSCRKRKGKGKSWRRQKRDWGEGRKLTGRRTGISGNLSFGGLPNNHSTDGGDGGEEVSV